MLSFRMVVAPRARAWGISASVHSRSMSSRIGAGDTLRALTLAFIASSSDREMSPKQPQPLPGHPPPRAPAGLLLVAAAVLFALMAVIVKVAAAALPGPQVAFVRFAIGLGACALAATRIRLRMSNRMG